MSANRRTCCMHVVYRMHAEICEQSCLREESLVTYCKTCACREGNDTFIRLDCFFKLTSALVEFVQK